MNNSEKIKRLSELQRKIKIMKEDISYVNNAKKLSFINGIEGYEDTRIVNPSSSLLSNIQKIAINILNEEVEEMEKEIESIFNNKLEGK